MTAGPATIRCTVCGSLNYFTAQLCEHCQQPLADERNAWRATHPDEAPAAPAYAPAPAAYAPADMRTRQVAAEPAEHMAELAEGETVYGYEPTCIKPDPFFGPIFRRTVRYYLSRDAIEVRSGILRKRTDPIAMYLVGLHDADLEVSEGFIQRLVKHTGNILIRTSDRDTPNLLLRDIHDAQEVKEKIRRTARAEQMARARIQPITEYGDGGGHHDAFGSH